MACSIASIEDMKATERPFEEIDLIVPFPLFDNDLFNRDYSYTQDELNFMLNNRYSKFPLCERIKFMADKISEVNFNGRLHKSKTIEKQLYERINMSRDLIQIYIDFFNSKFFYICFI